VDGFRDAGMVIRKQGQVVKDLSRARQKLQTACDFDVNRKLTRKLWLIKER